MKPMIKARSPIFPGNYRIAVENNEFFLAALRSRQLRLIYFDRNWEPRRMIRT